MKTCKSCEIAGKGNDIRTASGENLASLLRRHENQARRYAYSLAGNLEEAKELVQQAGYQVLLHWQSYDPVKSFQSWYLVIIKHLFLDARKRFSRKWTVSLDTSLKDDERLSLAESLSDGQPGPLEQLEQRERATAARNSLMALSEEQRAALILCDMEGLRYREAARKLGLKLGTLRSRVSRARAALRRMLELEQII